MPKINACLGKAKTLSFHQYKRNRSLILFYFFLFVLIPKGKYKGQDPSKLVSKNITAITRRTIPNTPIITLVKNNTAIRTAMTILIVLSSVPMFFFMTIFIK